MIKRIEIKRFKKFEAYSFTAHQGNVLVGPNNAGKSSILDALRLLEACVRFARRRVPQSKEYEGNYYPCYVVDESLNAINLDNAVFNYSDKDAIIHFYLSEQRHVWISLHPERQICFYIDISPGRFTSTVHFRKFFDLNIVVVPTISVLEVDEKLVDQKTLDRNAQTRLASRVFRNIWHRKPIDDFELFVKTINESWPGVEIKRPELSTSTPPPGLKMYYREGRGDRELSWSGFGFQAWLQIYTHFYRKLNGQINILLIDEPDIYIHSDLQKKLLDYIRTNFSQFFLATHSVEIINYASTNEIVSINSNSRKSKRINEKEDFLDLMTYLGSSANFDVARILKSKKVIFVEGNDEKLIRRFASKLDLKHLSSNFDVPFIQVGGFSHWRRATEAVWAFKNIMHLDIKAQAVFDRDYRCDTEVSEFIKNNSNDSFRLHILKRKEIENYLLDSRAICKASNIRCGSKKTVDEEMIIEFLEEAFESFKVETQSSLSSDYQTYMRNNGTRQDINTLIRTSLTEFDVGWAKNEFRLSKVPAKDILHKLNGSLQGRGHQTVTPQSIIDNFSRDRVAEDFFDLLRSLDEFMCP